MTAILNLNQCCRFCGPTPNHSDNSSYIYILRKMRDSNPHNISVTSDFKSGPLPFRQSSNHIFIYSCGSRRIRTFGTFRFGTLAVCWFKPLTHTSMVFHTGLEPVTLRLKVGCSLALRNQLS